MLTYIRTNPECTGGPDKVSKMHWGKAGWPDVGCFDGASEFGEGAKLCEACPPPTHTLRVSAWRGELPLYTVRLVSYGTSKVDMRLT